MASCSSSAGVQLGERAFLALDSVVGGVGEMMEVEVGVGVGMAVGMGTRIEVEDMRCRLLFSFSLVIYQ